MEVKPPGPDHAKLAEAALVEVVKVEFWLAQVKVAGGATLAVGGKLLAETVVVSVRKQLFAVFVTFKI